MGDKVVIIFDFDKTIIEYDSDDWVIENFGFSQLFNSLLFTMPYNFLMDKMMEELHLRGITIQDISNCLKKASISPNIISAIKSSYNSGCNLRIVSDANKFFIETILEHHGILQCFSEINSNTTYVNDQGRLKIVPYHDFETSTHGCNLCPPNLCKGLIMQRIQASVPEKKFIYLGDGKNDFCPTLKLTSTDYVMPRKQFPLYEAICSSHDLVQAAVHEWNDSEELERKLINLISSLVAKDNHVSVAREVVVAECKPQTTQSSVPEPFQKTVQVRH